MAEHPNVARVRAAYAAFDKADLDAHAVIVLRETAERLDGATLDVGESHVLAINADGKITDLWDLPTDPEAHDRFFDGR
jgi:hypothetical protein